MTKKELYDPSRYSIEWFSENYASIVHPYGSCIVEIREATGELYIDWLEVTKNPDEDHRRQGIGQNLLRYTQSFASQVGARVITSLIISRESLDAITKVYGEGAVTVHRLGNYGEPPGRDEDFPEWYTSGELYYELAPDEIQA